MTTDTLVGLASFVLNNNYIEFNGKIYRQKQGTAIGTKFAPAYAPAYASLRGEGLIERGAK